MMLSDAQYRIVVGVAGALLIAGITWMRFCGSLSLRDEKPSEPTGPTGTARQLAARSSGAASIYLDYIARDAATAGVRAPSIDDMSRKLEYRVFPEKHGEPPRVVQVGESFDAAGLRLKAERSSDLLVLSIQNTTTSDLAYEVTTAPSASVCNSARALPFDAMVIDAGLIETRTECTWHDGMSITIVKVETIAVSPLSRWYLHQLPPALVGVDSRVARGHRSPSGSEKCSPIVAQTVRSGLERGEIGWRDLVDFYARHRCQTYQFPSTYRAFTRDGEQALPTVDNTL
jgi:hypothetical protein